MSRLTPEREAWLRAMYSNGAHFSNQEVGELLAEIDALRGERNADQSKLREEARRETERRGYPEGQLQLLWRTTLRPYDSSEVVAAICEALTREGCSAWNGDGVSCVEQMVGFQYRRADALAARVRELETVMVKCALPYEALLMDGGSRKWIAPSVWKLIEEAVAEMRAALGRRGRMSTDTLAALLAALKRQPHLGDNRLAAEWLATRGVVVLPADHPLRTGQPSEAMMQAADKAPNCGDAGRAEHPTRWWNCPECLRNSLRAALAIIKEDLK